ncbi:MAG: ABC transporter ATP-binding protein [Actinomycetota bacterium]|nr:ABC transporter ATP-binding protein [Actinomycetota bacterium]
MEAPMGVRDAADIVIDMEEVSVVRGNTTLLGAVSWTVELDERWVILGPNGAGKTTLLQLAAALLHPTSGQVQLLGEPLGLTDVFELRPRIGFASAALAVRMQPGEIVRDLVVSAGYAVLGRWRERYDGQDLDRAMHLLDLMGVAAFADRPFGTLSEGERKRVQIARALMPDPEIMLLDEPAAGLDLGGREDLLARLSDIADEPDAPTLIMVTHHVEEIPASFSHAMLLRGGQVVSSGLIRDVITSANLTETFGLPLRLTRSGERYFARRRTAPHGRP